MINLNADIAEGWGAYDIGNDAELMKIIKSASVACGFHAGDPNTMHRLCMLAKEQGVSVGVHPGFNDLWGFGRRRIQMKPQRPRVHGRLPDRRAAGHGRLRRA